MWNTKCSCFQYYSAISTHCPHSGYVHKEGVLCKRCFSFRVGSFPSMIRHSCCHIPGHVSLSRNLLKNQRCTYRLSFCHKKNQAQHCPPDTFLPSLFRKASLYYEVC